MSKTDDVPQADDVNKLILTVEAVKNGKRKDKDIAKEIGGLTNRQGRYYRKATEILGLVTNDNNRAQLTQHGEKLFEAEDPEQMLKDAIKETPIMKELAAYEQELPKELDKKDIKDFLHKRNMRNKESETDTRRSKTIMEWQKFINK